MSTSRAASLRDVEADIVRGCYPALRRYAAVVAPMDVDADDLLQEALVKTLRSHRLCDLESPSAYLRRAVCSVATDHCREDQRRRSMLGRLGPPEPQRDVYPSDLAVLESLKPRQRAVLYLHEVEGVPYGEIAQMLGGREGSVRRDASRARRSLRAVITEEELDATA